MTPRQLRAAERLAPLIAYYMLGRAPADRRVPTRRGSPSLVGDQCAGWLAAWVGSDDPPDTVNGWAGWLAAHIWWSST